MAAGKLQCRRSPATVQNLLARDECLFVMERVAAQIVHAKQRAGRALLHHALQLPRGVYGLPVQVRDDVVSRDVRAMQRRVPVNLQNPNSHTVGVLPAREGRSRHARKNQQEDQKAHLLQTMNVLREDDAHQQQARNLHAVPAQVGIGTQDGGDSAESDVGQQRSGQRLRERAFTLNRQLHQPEYEGNLPRVLRSLDGVRQQHGKQGAEEKDRAIQKSAPSR